MIEKSLQAPMHLWKALPPTIRKLLKFAAMGPVSAGTNIGLTALQHEVFGIAAEIAFAVSLCIASMVNFLSCRYIVFPEKGYHYSTVRQMGGYIATLASFRLMEYAGFIVLHTLIGIHYLIACTALIAISFFCKFMLYNRVVFRTKKKAPPAI